MSTENLNPSTEPEVKLASEPTEQPVVVEPEGTDSPVNDGDESEAKPEKTAEQKEIERLRRQLTKRDRTQGKLYQEVQTYRERFEQLAPREQGEEHVVQPVDIERRAREIATVERITEKSNAVYREGTAKFKDFNDSLAKVVEEAGDLFDKRGFPTSVGEAVLESDAPAALIDFLGKNPDLAAELEGLTPTQLGRRIERIEAQMKTTTAKPVSKASEPINPIKGGGSNVTKSADKMSHEEYRAMRAKQGAKWAK